MLLAELFVVDDPDEDPVILAASKFKTEEIVARSRLRGGIGGG